MTFATNRPLLYTLIKITQFNQFQLLDKFSNFYTLFFSVKQIIQEILINLKVAKSRLEKVGLILLKNTPKMMLDFPSGWHNYDKICLALVAYTPLQFSAKGIPKHLGTVLLCSDNG